jgi:hypothetical protein
MATFPLLLLLAAAQAPPARAREVATKLPFAYRAFLEVRREAGAIGDPALRAAVEAQILTPWLPREAWAYSHLAEARTQLADPRLELPPPGKGDFLAAPGGNCEDGHHGYPGGLAVHTLACLRAARAIADGYRHVYGLDLHSDQLTAAVLWHDSLKAATLPWSRDGSCGPEPQIAGTGAHHVLGLAAGILRHLPADLLSVIAAAHSPDPKLVCAWLEAASVIAQGSKMTCPSRQTVEAFVHHRSDADSDLTALAWARYVAATPKGWARYDALLQDGNDLLIFSRSP